MPHLEHRFPIAAQFGRLNQTSDTQYDCRCPAHEDSTNSLHVTDAGDKLILNCLAGCETHEILRAFGENRWSALFVRSDYALATAAGGSAGKVATDGKPAAKIVRTYDYRDADGRLVHQTVRMVPKAFLQRRPANQGDSAGKHKAKRDTDGNWWIWSLQGITPVLYRLPELISAGNSRPETPVVLVEGEKDAENLAALGFLATTNPMGAGKWRQAYTDALRGRNVVIIPDVDRPGKNGQKPGELHAKLVAAELKDVAASVRILTLPSLGLEPKWDVSDWLAKGGTAEMLREAAENTPVYDPAANLNNTITNADALLDSLRPLPITEIERRIFASTGDWPRRISDRLFAHKEGADEIYWLTKPSRLFSWLAAETGYVPAMHRQVACATKEEVHEHLGHCAPQYEAIEYFPHFPPVETCYYTCPIPEPGDGSRLLEFMQRFSPATPEDADLILSLLATLLWGGGGGARPAFVITADSGRGAGKSTFARLLAELVGGALEISSKEDASVMVQRLLSPEGRKMRVALMDNVKSFKLSWAELEAAITSTVISGKEMYMGEGRRPNRITWILALNGVSLSPDMAQRSVVIQLGRPNYSGDWEQDTRRFLQAYRTEIIADIIGYLSGPKNHLTRHTRWGTWEREVLALVDNPDSAQDLILQRQGESDAERDEAVLILEHFRSALITAGYTATDRLRILIPSGTAALWLNTALGEKHSKVGSGRLLSQRIKEGAFFGKPGTPRLEQPNNVSTSARGIVWVGGNCPEYEPLTRFTSEENQFEAF